MTKLPRRLRQPLTCYLSKKLPQPLRPIRYHVIDKYEVVQNLPTAPRARVLAVDPITGEVYIVTDSAKSGLAVLVVGH